MYINCRAINFLLPLLLLLMLCPASAAKTIYVDDDAAGANDGTSWTNAYMFLQEALADARLAEKPVEIRVAQGIYRPNDGLMAIPEFDWRTTTFQLINGVTLKGGFAGLSAPDPNARDVELYETILSGDLNGDDGLDVTNNSENGYHVVTGNGTNETAVINGFTITGGFANGTDLETMGGGIYCGNESSGIIENCTIRANESTEGGGGIFCDLDSHPVIRWCTISNNSSEDGGGIECWMSRPTIAHCSIIGNIASSEGGAIECDTCYSVTIRNCTIMGNQAFVGGGICYDESHGVIENSIVWKNTATNGPTVALEEWMGDTSFVTVSYSDIWNGLGSVYLQSGCVLDWGAGNINSDPLFADPDNGDYHLRSEAGRWDPVGESWVVDDVTSPCIDAGNPNNPVAFEPFPNGEIINMGAYGGTAQASKSPSGLHASYGGGTGEPNNPYLIYTPEQMNTIGIHAEDWHKHFKLMEDIDLAAYTGTDFNMIGYRPDIKDKSFTGVFDGHGHTISNFTYTSTDRHHVGLFDYVEGKLAEIRDLGLIDPIVDARIIDLDVNQAKGHNVGSLVSYLGEGTVHRCYVQGGSVSGDKSVGGLVAYNHKGIVVDCYSTTDVSGGKEVGGLVGYNGGTIIGCYAFSNITGELEVGGLVGYCYFDSTIRESSASGNVTGSRSVGGLVGSSSQNSTIQGSYSTGCITGIREVGGLVGRSRGELSNCYTNGSVSGGQYVGGLVGFLGGIMMDCYSVTSIIHEPIEGFEGNPRISGLVGTGYDPNDIHGSFWDIETSGRTISFGGMGLTTAEMQTAGTFLEAGWDFTDETDNGTDDIWWILEGQDYPRLWWELIPEN